MTKRLYRSENRIIAGICGGLAEYFDIDPVIVRAIFIGLVFAGGSGFLIYLILLIIVPPKDKVFQPYIEVDEKGEAKIPNEEKTTQDSTFSHLHEEKEKLKEEFTSRADTISKKITLIAGIIFIFVGAFFLLRMLFSWMNCKFILPAIFIIIGTLFLVFSKKSKKR